MKSDFQDRVLLPRESDGKPLEFKIANGLVIARGYVRVVVHDYGPYIEFSPDQFCYKQLGIPDVDTWKSAQLASKSINYTFPDGTWIVIHYTKEGTFQMNAFALETALYPKLVRSYQEKVQAENDYAGSLW